MPSLLRAELTTAARVLNAFHDLQCSMLTDEASLFVEEEDEDTGFADFFSTDFLDEVAFFLGGMVFELCGSVAGGETSRADDFVHHDDGVIFLLFLFKKKPGRHSFQS